MKAAARALCALIFALCLVDAAHAQTAAKVPTPVGGAKGAGDGKPAALVLAAIGAPAVVLGLLALVGRSHRGGPRRAPPDRLQIVVIHTKPGRPSLN